MKQKASEGDQTGEIREETHDVERLKIKRRAERVNLFATYIHGSGGNDVWHALFVAN